MATFTTSAPWLVPPPPSPTVNPKRIDRPQYDKLTKELLDAYWELFPNDAAILIEKDRLGLEEIPQAPITIINPTNVPLHLGPVIRSSDPNVLSATLLHNIKHGTNFTFDELSDVHGRLALAMGRDYNWGANPENWDEVQSQADYLYTSNVVIPTTVTALTAAAGGAATASASPILHLTAKAILFSELTGRTLDLGYGLGNLFANGEYYTLTDNLTDMYRNLGLDDTWAGVAGGLSNPGYWAGLGTRRLIGLENGGREALAPKAIRRNTPSIIETALIDRFPLYGNYRLSAAINRAALDFDGTVSPEYFRSPDKRITLPFPPTSTLIEPVTPSSVDLTLRLTNIPTTLSSAERAGIPRGDRGNVRYLSGGSSNVPDDLMLIHRSKFGLPTEGDQIVFAPRNRKLEGSSDRWNTFHFTLDRPVLSHIASWDLAPHTLLIPYKHVVERGGLPLNNEIMDTYFGGFGRLSLDAPKAKILTADFKEYLRLKAAGADVTYSPQLREAILAGDRALSNLIATDFVWNNSRRPTTEDIRLIESETGLSANLNPFNHHHLSDGMGYYDAPPTHFNYMDSRVAGESMENVGFTPTRHFLSGETVQHRLDYGMESAFRATDKMDSRVRGNIVINYLTNSTNPKYSAERLKSWVGDDSIWRKVELVLQQRNIKYSSAPTHHLNGDQAVQMFKDVGDDIIIPENSPLYERLLAYVPEVKLRYGINDQLTNDYIARALYKHIIKNFSETAAVNTRGEPLILFRGDTKPYTKLLPRMSPLELLTNSESASMDNSLGTLFLGDFRTPDTNRGVGRYLVGWQLNSGADGWERVGSWDGITLSMPESPTPDSYLLFKGMVNNMWPAAFIKAPARFSPTGTNDLNAFVVKTPGVFNGTNAVGVANIDDLLPRMPQWRGPEGVEFADRADQAMHYLSILNEMQQNNQGLLWSSRWNPNIMKDNVRDEHYMYNYYAVPNFNILNVKHVLPYDLRIPRDFNDPNIYKKLGGKLWK